MTTIELRLAAVERQLRFHRPVIAGLLVALVALVGYGAMEGVPDVIRAREFSVVNQQGIDVLVARADSDGAGVFTVSTKEGRTAFGVAVGLGGGGGLAVFNRDGRWIWQVGSDSGGSGTLSLAGANGRPMFHVLAPTRGGGALSLYNNDGSAILQSFPNSNGGGSLGIDDSRGINGLHLGAAEDGGYLRISNRTGETVVSANADEYGMGYVGAFDREGKGRTLTPR
jgi:hypothetical protein